MFSTGDCRVEVNIFSLPEFHLIKCLKPESEALLRRLYSLDFWKILAFKSKKSFVKYEKDIWICVSQAYPMPKYGIFYWGYLTRKKECWWQRASSYRNLHYPQNAGAFFVFSKDSFVRRLIVFWKCDTYIHVLYFYWRIRIVTVCEEKYNFI